MSKSKKRPEYEHQNHERWLVSYADFITLLFAFFVMMFASSQADKGKAQQVSDSVKKALEGQKMSSVLAAILGGSPRDLGPGSAQMRGPGGADRTAQQHKSDALAELMPSLKVLSQELRGEIEAGRVQIDMQSRGLVVSFKQAALFPSGGDEISADTFPSLNKVAAAIKRIPNPVRLEGHTDSRPISTARFHSNWDLSAARSIALLNLLSGQFAVPVGRISVAGYADNAPIASNETEEGRARNRRVDVVILNEQGMLAEPSKAGASAEEKASTATQAPPAAAGSALQPPLSNKK